MLFQAPRGTTDILPEDQKYWRYFRDKVQQIATQFGYECIDTPIFEDAGLFSRTIGEITDIVEKETYSFKDRGGDQLTLRPEGTAPVCRAYLEHGMHNVPQPVRLYYLCPVFRYERPQAGRYRQHHQFGIEVFGDEDASVDTEVIEMSWRFLESVGLTNLSLNINSIGDTQCRPDYIRVLQEYYQAHANGLCLDCKRRLNQNPLRLLDCKQETCQTTIGGAPHSVTHLCSGCEEHWARLLSYLDDLSLTYTIDHRLVRGFDYYTRTVFEITPPSEGRQSTLVGGGRYDALIQELGGQRIPGIGFGMGVERVITNIRQTGIAMPDCGDPKVLVAHIGNAARPVAMNLSSQLRKAGTTAVLAPTDKTLRSQLRYASSIGATHAVIIGDDEIQKGVVVLRDLSKSEQREINPDHLVQILWGKPPTQTRCRSGTNSC